VIFLTDTRTTTTNEFSSNHGWQVSRPGTVRTKAKAAASTTTSTTRAAGGGGGGWTNENRRGFVVRGLGIVVFLGEGRVRRHLSKKVSSRQSPVDGDGSGLVDSDECSSNGDLRSHVRGVLAAVVPTTTSTTTSAMLLHSTSHLLDQVVVFHGNDAEPNGTHFPDIQI
jgi:hypothetical protein